MATKVDLQKWILQILASNDGSLHYIEIAKKIWQVHESDLKMSGNLFYTWQYDMRWAANRLRKSGDIKKVDLSTSGIWKLS